jgi:proline racemase/trans-L-3-hydroxyproline dehydratase
MEPHNYLGMCGHGTIGVVTVALSIGLIPKKEPMTEVLVDTPAGLVKAWAHIEDGNIVDVTIENVPAFVYASDVKIDVKDLGTVTMNIAFGGSFFGIVEASTIGLDLEKCKADEIIKIGNLIKEAANEQIKVKHPILAYANKINIIEFCGPSNKLGVDMKNFAVPSEGHIDRSPCGTGTSAEMARLWNKGELSLNQDFVTESILGTTFKGRLVGITKVGEFDAVVSHVCGSAYIYGFNNLVIERNEPFKQGFRLIELRLT